MGSLQKDYSRKKLTGKVYTPRFIVEKILDDTGFAGRHCLGKSLLDPACGDGRFLIPAAERIIQASPRNQLKNNLEKIHGWDIDEEAVGKTIDGLNRLIAPFGIQVDWNIRVADALRQKQAGGQFDFVVGNPPYIRIQHLEASNRKYIQEHFEFCKSGSTDIYIAFYELAAGLLSQDGVCGLITPNTFLFTETGKALRDFFAERRCLRQITNYGSIQLFEDATTYSAIVIFGNSSSDTFLFQSAETTVKYLSREIGFEEVTGKKFWSLSTRRPEVKKGVRLGDIARIHVGITTLSDKLYIMPAVKEEGDFIHLQSKHHGIIRVERGVLRPIIKASTLKSSGEPVGEYVIFPYAKQDGKHRILPEERLASDFPKAYAYLQSVKPLLAKRDNGRPNPVAWYAFGRSQGLETSFGPKILFAPMNKKPNFILSTHPDATFYSGYCIKYDGDYRWLLAQLNSKRMEEFIRISARDFRGGWKAYNKKVVQEFLLEGEDPALCK